MMTTTMARLWHSIPLCNLLYDETDTCKDVAIGFSDNEYGKGLNKLASKDEENAWLTYKDADINNDADKELVKALNKGF